MRGAIFTNAQQVDVKKRELGIIMLQTKEIRRVVVSSFDPNR